MRIASPLALVTLLGFVAGCGTNAGEPAAVAEGGRGEEPKAERGAEPREVWTVVKVRFPLPDGKVTEDFAGIKFAMLAPTKADAGNPPEVAQPAMFDHRHHTGQLGIDCRYCHGGGESTADTRLKTCMNCHQQIANRGNANLVPKGERWSFVVARGAEKSRQEIELTECDAAGRVLSGRPIRRGIYKGDGDELLIALPVGDAPADYRPDSFEPAALPPKPGRGFAGAAVFHLKK